MHNKKKVGIFYLYPPNAPGQIYPEAKCCLPPRLPVSMHTRMHSLRKKKDKNPFRQGLEE